MSNQLVIANDIGIVVRYGEITPYFAGGRKGLWGKTHLLLECLAEDLRGGHVGQLG